MYEDRTADEREHRIVGNAEGRLSVWSTDTPVPHGWRPLDFAGSLADCLAEIDRRGMDDAALAGSPANDTGTTLLHLVSRSLREHGERPAVSDEETTLSYTELDRRSDRVAWWLVRAGVGRGDRVAVHRERDVELLVCILGILKAGAAYVAVDSRYPKSRRDMMVRDCLPRVILTQPGWEDMVDCPPGCAVLAWTGAEEVTAARLSEPRSTDVASVLFTSGSSAAPKAIMLEHRNLAYFAANGELPALRPGDRVGQVSSVSFDAFHFECWCALAQGAEVVVLPPIADLVARDLQRELRRRRITAMLCPTMVINHVVHEDRDAFAALRLLLSGGDVLQPEACRMLLSGSFSGGLYNLYGPAEGTTACSGHHVEFVDPDADLVPIGTELTGSAVYLLDADLNAVPPETEGELYIGGAGVTRGYLAQPALTAGRFRPDPFAADGSRMYATGDLARRRPDGVLEFLGRIDDQVKIRGYRVEPREVERVLARHPKVRDVAVTTAGTVDDRRLIAVVVPYDTLPPQELRDFAERELPDYMVPSSVLMTGEIPANEHGKRAAQQIDELVAEHLTRARAHVPPKDEVESYLAGLWEGLLSVETVGSTDDFLPLGGNSLIAFRVQRRVRRDLGVRLEAREVLQIGELRRLADLIRERQDGDAE